MWADVCMAYQIWKNDVSYEQTSVFLHLKFMRPKRESRKSSKHCKEIGTGVNLSGHCYNADDRMIKVSSKFKNGMR